MIRRIIFIIIGSSARETAKTFYVLNRSYLLREYGFFAAFALFTLYYALSCYGAIVLFIRPGVNHTKVMFQQYFSPILKKNAVQKA